MAGLVALIPMLALCAPAGARWAGFSSLVTPAAFLSPFRFTRIRLLAGCLVSYSALHMKMNLLFDWSDHRLAR